MANFNPYRMINPYPGMYPSPSFNPLPNMNQQLPYNSQNFYQLQMEKQFQSHMEFISGKHFKFDSNERLLLKPFQCSKCLKDFDNESNLFDHFEDCEQFSCKYSECRNKLYTAIYVANENFESNEELENHVKENHNISLLKVSNDEADKSNSNLLLDFDEVIKVKVEKEKNIIEDKLKSNDNKEQDLLEQIDNLKQENIEFKLKNDNLFRENECLKEKNSIRNKNVQTLIENLQMILTNFSKEEFELNVIIDKEETKNERIDQERKTFSNPISTQDILNTKSNASYSLGTKQKLYSCESCQEFFTFKNDLLKHSKVHKLKDFPKTCDQCEYKAHNKDKLDRHRKSVHERLLYECDEKFSSTDGLKMHTENNHKENVFKCAECDAKFKTFNDIRKHEQAHLSESFCHTFNNFPKCQYGSSCIFLHSKAPFCSYDGRCFRPSCQYRHRYGCLEKNKFSINNFMNTKGFNINNGKGRHEDRRNKGVNNQTNENNVFEQNEKNIIET